MPEFGAATAAMVAAWRFDPAMKGGKPSWSLMKREQEFNLGNDDFPVNDSARRLLKALKKTPCPVLSNTSALDVPLKGRYQPAPIIPTRVAAISYLRRSSNSVKLWASVSPLGSLARARTALAMPGWFLRRIASCRNDLQK